MFPNRLLLNLSVPVLIALRLEPLNGLILGRMGMILRRMGMILGRMRRRAVQCECGAGLWVSIGRDVMARDDFSQKWAICGSF